MYDSYTYAEKRDVLIHQTTSNLVSWWAGLQTHLQCSLKLQSFWLHLYIFAFIYYKCSHPDSVVLMNHPRSCGLQLELTCLAHSPGTSQLERG